MKDICGPKIILTICSDDPLTPGPMTSYTTTKQATAAVRLPKVATVGATADLGRNQE